MSLIHTKDCLVGHKNGAILIVTKKLEILTLSVFLTKKTLGKKVLEVGCGGGERTHLFVKAGCNVTAVDLVDKRKTSLVSGHKFVVADGRNLPFKDETFDVVVSF